MAERTYLSIGDVLSLLKDEFPDITISKIRFLESQGLLDPERTPSGYRKFYEEDVDRLRWILRQQRENFLPLKVIKGRLGGNGGLDEGESPDPEDADAAGTAGAGAGVGVAHRAAGSGSAAGAAMATTVRPRGSGTSGTSAQGPGERPVGAAGGARLHEGPKGGQGEPAAGSYDLDREPPVQESRAREPTGQTSVSPAPAPERVRSRQGVPSPQAGGRADAGAPPADAPGRAGSPSRSIPPRAGAGGGRDEPVGRRPAPAEATEEESGGPLSIGLSGVNLTAGELSEASGLTEEDLRELERYG
ncbi:MAG TPA: MerR family transcriptional regulator, partial [Acidimicrobiales bacterium]